MGDELTLGVHKHCGVVDRGPRCRSVARRLLGTDGRLELEVADEDANAVATRDGADTSDGLGAGHCSLVPRVEADLIPLQKDLGRSQQRCTLRGSGCCGGVQRFYASLDPVALTTARTRLKLSD